MAHIPLSFTSSRPLIQSALIPTILSSHALQCQPDPKTPTPKPLLNSHHACPHQPRRHRPVKKRSAALEGIVAQGVHRHLFSPCRLPRFPHVSHTRHTPQLVSPKKKSPKGMLRPNVTFHRTSFPRRRLSGEKPPPHLPVVRRRSNTPLTHTLYLCQPADHVSHVQATRNAPKGMNDRCACAQCDHPSRRRCARLRPAGHLTGISEKSRRGWLLVARFKAEKISCMR